MEIGTVRQVDIDSEMRVAYLDYAMSVIVARALPDARDGLKPVQRRILYARHDMGIRPDTPYKKSARIVGEVLGKYHPHGDASVYDAMARMAQGFSLRYPAVDGQGNFGSIDGDRPAAMRYTEARLAAIAAEMLVDLDKDTVGFVANFDDSLEEPTVLPAAVPNLLVNGASGIAVGMATSIPPHNLGEVCDALLYMLDNWRRLEKTSVEDLMQFIHGPDFPTGGIVFRRLEGESEDVIAQAYGNGRGKFTLRARVHVEEMSRSRHRIVVTELPYQVNKSGLIERMAQLTRDGRIEGITDLRDESDRRGMRLVIELTRTVDPDQVLSQLFKLTPLESTFSLILLALVDGEPRMLTLKKALLIYLDHRQQVVTRRSRFELARFKARAHVLEGLLIALDNLDEVIAVIRRSRTVDTARKNLCAKLKLSKVQADAILDMPLKRLAALERRRIEDEYGEKQRLIKKLAGLLRSPTKVRGVVREELVAIREQYADLRRTQVVDAGKEEVAATELGTDEPYWVAVSRSGLVTRTAGDGAAPRVPSRPNDAPVELLSAPISASLYLFTADGRAVAFPVHQLPEGLAWEGAGVHYGELTPLARDDEVAAAAALPPGAEEGFLVLATSAGNIKRIDLSTLPGVTGEPFVVMRVEEGDSLRWAVVTSGEQELLLTTAGGRAIRFREDEVRAMGLSAAGVKSVRLAGKRDRVVGLSLVRPGADLLVVAADGRGKRTSLSEYPTQGRYGQGILAARFAATGVGLAGSCVVKGEDPIVFVTEKGAAKTVRARTVPSMGRAARGNIIIALRGSDTVSAVLCPVTDASS
ncbi:MAG: DNA gyrase subunit A [Anaerolineales bacterium]|nr:MAG: DNA gyrase subunit A [Anaerolineales bacterium]